MKTFNIPRIYAKHWEIEADPKEDAWISIAEPDDESSIVSNPILDKLPNLKIAFFDIQEPLYDKDGKLAYSPITKKQVNKILKFISQNRDKNIIVNCAAGISRSGAICRFLEECLDYEWSEYTKKLALPNYTVYKMLKEQWQTFK